MINVVISVLLVLIVGRACYYIYREKKNGRKCIGCPSSGSGNCHCNATGMKHKPKQSSAR